MPGGASILRQLGVQLNHHSTTTGSSSGGQGGNGADTSTRSSSILHPRRSSVTTDRVDENILLPRHLLRRRLSVTDKELLKWFPAATATSLDIADHPGDTGRPTSSLIDIDQDKQDRESVRLPSLVNTSKTNPMYTHHHSKNMYTHLETSPSVESSAGREKPTNTTVTTTSITSVTRITSARQRLKSARQEHAIIDRSSSNDNDDTDSHPTLLPHHPHSPPAPSPIPERRVSLIPGGNLLTVPELVNSMPQSSSIDQTSDNVQLADRKKISTPHDQISDQAMIEKVKRGKISKKEFPTQPSIDRPSVSSILSRKGAASSNGRQGTFEQNGPGVFLNDGQRHVDFILVYQSGHSMSMERQRRYFEKNLQQEGLILELDPLDGNEDVGKLCFLKVHAPWNTLCRSAEMLQMKMPLKNAELPDDCTSLAAPSPNRAAGLCELAYETLCAPWFNFNDTEKLLIGRQPNYVTAQFTRARIEQFMITDTETFFTPTQRIRIVYDIMQRAKCDPDNNKKRGLQWLLKNGVYLGAYPPHDGGTETRHLSTGEPEKWSQRQVLKHTWANFNRVFKPQPLNLVRAYFGEKVGFYFAWLGFYTQMLIFPSVVGVICFLYGIFSLPTNPMIIELCDMADKEPANLTMCPVCVLPYCKPWKMHDGCEGAKWNYRFDHESHVFMAVFTLVWATVFMELWKRKEAELACEWDAYDAEQEEEGMRPEYEARTQVIRISPVTNEEEPFIPACKRMLWGLQSLSGLFMLILCVVASLVALITVRILLYGILGDFGGIWRQYQFEFASLVIHVLTFIIVMTLGWVYEKAAHRLTELECPRTQADYLSSYIWKVFIFEILNNFAPVLYAALIRGRSGLPQNQTLLLEMCDPGGCLNEVVQAIGILLLARLLISNAAELGVPFLKSVLKTMRLGAAVNPDDEPTVLRNLPRWQKDYTLNETNMDGVYAEYLEMMVQFGYICLFVSAFPLAPLICLLNNIVEIRIDATNFVTSFRRPLPTRVSGIRIWRRCLNIMIKLSVLCNGAFLAFTSELIPKLVYRFWYSTDGTTHGYIMWTLAKVNTTHWPEFLQYNNSSVCYYRDFRESADSGYGPNLVWWQVMVARLSFFIVFVIAFYFIQWLCDFLVPDVPQHVKLRVDRANFLAKQALYGHEMKGGTTSMANTPSMRPHIRNLNRSPNGPWSTTSSGLGEYLSQSNQILHKSRPQSPVRMLTVSNGDLTKNHFHAPPPKSSSLDEKSSHSKTTDTISNGLLRNANGFVNSTAIQKSITHDHHDHLPNSSPPLTRENALNDSRTNVRKFETTYV